MAEPAELGNDGAPNGDGIRYRPRGRVIPAEEIDAWQRGRSYLEAAKGEAERIRNEAHGAFEDAKRNGFEEGRAEGAEAASRLLAETALHADRHLAAADGQIVDLALAVVREILGDFDVEDLTRQAVRHALAKERQHQHLTLHVAPGLIDGMRADLDTEIDPEWRRLISVEPGSDDDRGRCRLASEIGFVDLGIEAQLRALHQGLLDGLDRQVEE